MEIAKVLYKANCLPYSNRVWKIFFKFSIVPFVFMLFPFLFKEKVNFIALLWTLVMMSVIIMMLVNSIKWAKNEIVYLAVSSDNFEIEVLNKNVKTFFMVAKSNIIAKAAWSGGRPAILVLSLFDSGTKLADLYSGGSAAKVITLEDIYYLIEKNKEFSGNK